jgi:uncharacterized membrane protein (UPF0127 family)
MGPETPTVTDRPRTFVALALVAVAATAGCVGPFAGGTDPTPTEAPDRTATSAESTPSPTPIHPNYEQTTVTVLDGESGAELGRVEAAIADNTSLRQTGLSDTDRLPENRGMLFVYGAERDLTYVMRRMSFDLDIVFVYGNGTIESIHERPAPEAGEDGNSIEASGEGQYVLEVNRGWTDERGVEAGDRIEFELPG